MIGLGLIATIATKFLGIFGSGFLSSVLGVITNGQTQTTARLGIFGSALANAMQAEVDARRIASQERVALWGSWTYQLLVYLIVAPPALYHAAIWADTVFRFPWSVDAAPERFEQWGFIIMSTFIGAGAFVSSVTGLFKGFRK